MNLILFEPQEYEKFSQGPLLRVPLSDYRASHMTKVLKLKKNDSVKIGKAGENAIFQMRVQNIDKEAVTLGQAEEISKAPSLFPVVMIIGQIRPICMKRVLRDLVCLGIGKAVLTLSDLTEKSYAEAHIYKSQEYKRFLLDGGMQAASPLLTEVDFASRVEEAIQKAGKAQTKVLLDNQWGEKSLSCLESFEGKAILAVGPERGWSERERKVFVQENGYVPMKLGQRILRTETAVPAGGAVFLSRLKFL